VLFEVGKEALLKGDLDTALALWKTCFQITGPHQQRIIGLLAGRLPARVYLESLAPDWRTMRSTWTSYRNAGRRQDLNELIAYAAQILERDACVKNGIPPVYLWNWLSEMHGDLGQLDQRLECLEKAYHCDRRVYHVRHQLGYALKASGRYAEAEPHLRWCSARRPENKDLTAAILEVTNLRLARREPRVGSLPSAVPTTSVQQATHYLSVP
jgi:tetratricopeptide (TPR) repeat protein